MNNESLENIKKPNSKYKCAGISGDKDKAASRFPIKQEEVSEFILQSLKNNEMSLSYQPQVNTDSMKVYGMEALLRWNHPKLGLMYPEYFIELIDNDKTMKCIDEFVLLNSCMQLKQFHSEGYRDMIMSMNILPKQLEDEEFALKFEKVLRKTRVNAKYICMEIKEDIFLNLTERIMKTVSDLRSTGAKIYIDNFGKKYTQLNFLYNLSVDGIKLDKAFTRNMNKSQKRLTIAKNIMKLAEELKIDVVAEGVERSEQIDCLRSIHCTKMQGFIFGKPVEASEFKNILENIQISKFA